MGEIPLPPLSLFSHSSPSDIRCWRPVVAWGSPTRHGDVRPAQWRHGKGGPPCMGHGHTMLAVRLLYGTGSPVWARCHWKRRKERGLGKKMLLVPLCLRKRGLILRGWENFKGKEIVKGDLLEPCFAPRSPLCKNRERDLFSQCGGVNLIACLAGFQFS